MLRGPIIRHNLFGSAALSFELRSARDIARSRHSDAGLGQEAERTAKGTVATRSGATTVSYSFKSPAHVVADKAGYSYRSFRSPGSPPEALATAGSRSIEHLPNGLTYWATALNCVSNTAHALALIAPEIELAMIGQRR